MQQSEASPSGVKAVLAEELLLALAASLPAASGRRRCFARSC